jgi:hypothetical protein
MYITAALKGKKDRQDSPMSWGQWTDQVQPHGLVRGCMFPSQVLQNETGSRQNLLS